MRTFPAGEKAEKVAIAVYRTRNVMSRYCCDSAGHAPARQARRARGQMPAAAVRTSLEEQQGRVPLDAEPLDESALLRAVHL